MTANVVFNRELQVEPTVLNLSSGAEHVFSSWRTWAIARNRLGHFYLGGSGPDSNRILHLDADGNALGTFTQAGGQILSLDLAADQCTLYIGVAGNQIRRFDVCTGNDLGAVINGAGPTVCVLPDGSLLVLGGNNLRRFSAGGTLLRTYDIHSSGTGEYSRSLALSPTGERAFYSRSFLVEQIDLETGETTDVNVGPELPTSNMGLAVAGGFVAAQDVGGSDVPTLTTWALVALTLGIAVVAASRA